MLALKRGLLRIPVFDCLAGRHPLLHLGRQRDATTLQVLGELHDGVQLVANIRVGGLAPPPEVFPSVRDFHLATRCESVFPGLIWIAPNDY